MLCLAKLDMAVHGCKTWQWARAYAAMPRRKLSLSLGAYPDAPLRGDRPQPSWVELPCPRLLAPRLKAKACKSSISSNDGQCKADVQQQQQHTASLQRVVTSAGMKADDVDQATPRKLTPG